MRTRPRGFRLVLPQFKTICQIGAVFPMISTQHRVNQGIECRRKVGTENTGGLIVEGIFFKIRNHMKVSTSRDL